MFFITVNQLDTIRQQPCRARGARAHNLCLHLFGQFVHGNVFFFPFIDILMCTIQCKQSSDTLIKYVA